MPSPKRREVDDQIALVGATSAGKSHLGNVLLGEERFEASPEHGTTVMSGYAWTADGRGLVDTPGLLDGDESREEAMSIALTSSIVLYVTHGQLYEPEMAFLREMAQQMRPDEHQVILYLSKHDVRLKTMPEQMRRKIARELTAQVAELRNHSSFYGVPVTGPVVGGIGHYGAIRKAVDAAWDG